MQLGQREAEELERHDLGQVALGRGHADLGPGPGVEHAVGRPGHGGVDHVGDHQHLGAEAGGLLHGLRRIERLARLGDAHTECALRHHRVPVAELAGDVDLGGQLDPVLNGVLGHQGGVVAAAAGHDAHLVDLAQVVGAQPHFVEHQVAGGIPAVEQRVGHRPGLLVHLLGHEVLVAVLLGRLEVPGDVQLLGDDRGAGQGGDRDGARGEDGHSSSARAKSWSACPSRAGMSEASNATPSRRPRTSGVARRAATIVSGSSACTTAMEKAPRTAPSAARVASASASPSAMWSSMRWATTSVSVAERMVWPPATSSARRAAWFSMIPLWMTARRPVQSRWGWALSDGGVPVGGPAGVPDPGGGDWRAAAGARGVRRPVRPPSGCRRPAGPARSPRRPPAPPRPSRSPGTRACAARPGSRAGRRARR